MGTSSLRADVSYFLCSTREAKETGDVCMQARELATFKSHMRNLQRRVEPAGAHGPVLQQHFGM